MSAFRGPDTGRLKATKILQQHLRRACQVPDPDSKHYLGDAEEEEVDLKKVRKELEHASFHFLEHLLEALYLLQREQGKPWTEYYSFLMGKLIGPMWGQNGGDGP